MLIQNDLMTQEIEGIYRTTSKGMKKITFETSQKQAAQVFVPISQQKSG